MTAGIVVFSCLVVLVLFVDVSRRKDVLDDVVVVPTSGVAAVAPLAKGTTTYPLSRTAVSRAGAVSLRLSVRGGGVSPSAITIRIFSRGKTLLATCRYARGSLRDTNVMRCPVGNLALVWRVRITLNPKAKGLGVIGSRAGVGTLLVPRSHTLRGRLETVLGRIGAKHPAPFTGWLVPIGTVLWLSALLLVSVWIFRSPRDDE
jgi:hypothetical protein